MRHLDNSRVKGVGSFSYKLGLFELCVLLLCDGICRVKRGLLAAGVYPQMLLTHGHTAVTGQK